MRDTAREYYSFYESQQVFALLLNNLHKLYNMLFCFVEILILLKRHYGIEISTRCLSVLNFTIS